MDKTEIIQILGGNDNIAKAIEIKENDIICDFGIPEFNVDISIFHVDKTNEEILSVTVLLDEGKVAFNIHKNIPIKDNEFYLIKDYSKIDRRPFVSKGSTNANQKRNKEFNIEWKTSTNYGLH